MFDSLSSRIDAALSKVRGRGKLDARTVDATLKEIRLALLEADVNFKVVRTFVGRLRERMVGEEISKALNPSQQVVKAVNEELTRALGGEAVPLTLSGSPAVIMLAGLQGSGKTTAAGKLAVLLRKQGRHPMLVACDLQRPAAVEQLKVNGARAGVPVYAPVTSGDPVGVARDAIGRAGEIGADTVIVDTAGRLHVDGELLEQARAIREAVGATETLFVIDAMIGQEAVNVAKSFLDDVGFDGIILSKLDGDARGGAALSVREVTDRPIKFASVGEKLEDFEAFHPDRMAGRILDMGDVLTLIEKAEEVYDADSAAAAEEALMSGQFTLDDFLQQMQMLKKMGGAGSLMKMLPGMGKQLKDVDIDDKQVDRVEAIIRSMTPGERADIKILNGKRRRRIANGSGTAVHEVNQLVNNFKQAQKVMKSVGKMAGMGGGGGRGGGGTVSQARALRQLQKSGGLPDMGLADPGATPQGNRAARRASKSGASGASKGGGGGLGGFSGLQKAPKDDD